jgi:hypothetical protein
MAESAASVDQDRGGPIADDLDRRPRFEAAHGPELVVEAQHRGAV